MLVGQAPPWLPTAKATLMAQPAAQSEESFALYPVFKVRNLGLGPVELTHSVTWPQSALVLEWSTVALIGRKIFPMEVCFVAATRCLVPRPCIVHKAIDSSGRQGRTFAGLPTFLRRHYSLLR